MKSKYSNAVIAHFVFIGMCCIGYTLTLGPHLLPFSSDNKTSLNPQIVKWVLMLGYTIAGFVLLVVVLKIFVWVFCRGVRDLGFGFFRHIPPQISSIVQQTQHTQHEDSKSTHHSGHTNFNRAPADRRTPDPVSLDATATPTPPQDELRKENYDADRCASFVIGFLIPLFVLVGFSLPPGPSVIAQALCDQRSQDTLHFLCIGENDREPLLAQDYDADPINLCRDPRFSPFLNPFGITPLDYKWTWEKLVGTETIPETVVARQFAIVFNSRTALIELLYFAKPDSIRSVFRIWNWCYPNTWRFWYPEFKFRQLTPTLSCRVLCRGCYSYWCRKISVEIPSGSTTIDTPMCYDCFPCCLKPTPVWSQEDCCYRCFGRVWNRAASIPISDKCKMCWWRTFLCCNGKKKAYIDYRGSTKLLPPGKMRNPYFVPVTPVERSLLSQDERAASQQP